MVPSPEKAAPEAANTETRGIDVDGPIEHPGISTLKDKETRTGETDSDSIHSCSHSSLGSISHYPDNPNPPQRSKSKASSVRSRPLTVVPRAKRRGLLARFALIPEVENPYDYKRSTKWFITFQVAIAAAAAPMGSAILLRESMSPLS